MATTIKVDGTKVSNTWQDDQTLDRYADVDLFVPAQNLADTYVPQSQVGKGADKKPEDPTIRGGDGTDTV